MARPPAQRAETLAGPCQSGVAVGMPGGRVAVQSCYFIAQDAYVGQVAVNLAKIQAVADYEPVRDLKSSVKQSGF